jgi:hypothetical protein
MALIGTSRKRTRICSSNSRRSGSSAGEASSARMATSRRVWPSVHGLGGRGAPAEPRRPMVPAALRRSRKQASQTRRALGRSTPQVSHATVGKGLSHFTSQAPRHAVGSALQPRNLGRRNAPVGPVVQVARRVAREVLAAPGAVRGTNARPRPMARMAMSSALGTVPTVRGSVGAQAAAGIAAAGKPSRH